MALIGIMSRIGRRMVSAVSSEMRVNIPEIYCFFFLGVAECSVITDVNDSDMRSIT